MKTLKLSACIMLTALSACADIDDSVDMTEVTTGANLSVVKMNDAVGRNVKE